MLGNDVLMKGSRAPSRPATTSASQTMAGTPGRRSAVERRYGASTASPVQAKGSALAGRVQEIAAAGVGSGDSTLPHLSPIQRSFGRHDVSSIQAHVGGTATDACD